MGTNAKLKGLVVNQPWFNNPLADPCAEKASACKQRWWVHLLGGVVVVSSSITVSIAPSVVGLAAPAVRAASPEASTAAKSGERLDTDLAPPTTLAQAAQNTLQSWNYNPVLGRLEFSTRWAARPSLFTLENPSRIVVDVPNVKWGKPEEKNNYAGRVQSVRVSQFNPTTTRFVLDIDPAQPISQRELQLLTASPERWAVQLLMLPRFDLPQGPIASSSSTSTPSPAPSPRPELPQPPASTSVKTHILGIETIAEGVLVRTNGPVNVSTRRVFNPHRVAVDFPDTDVSQMKGPRELTINQFGVSMLRAGQFQPTVARIALDVDSTSGGWEGRYDSSLGGVILTPAGTTVTSTPSPSSSNTQSNNTQSSGTNTTISSVQVQGNQLVIKANGFMFYRSNWDPSSRTYRISVSPARLPERMNDPGLAVNGPVERIRFVQENDRTVNILVEPTRGVSVREPYPGLGSKQITLEFTGDNLVAAPPSPPPEPAQSQPTLTPQPATRNGIVVAIDAGHGGRDPGAIGVGGIREKDVNLAISTRVQQLLLQQGFTVIMTRRDDREILLQPRIDSAVAGGASILVSIHSNALNRSNISGIETYYLRPDSARLAQIMHRNLVAGTGAVNRNIRRARFFMVRKTPTTMPSVLLEMGYLTNPTEARRLGSPEYQERMAQSIVRGIMAYFGR